MSFVQFGASKSDECLEHPLTSWHTEWMVAQVCDLVQNDWLYTIQDFLMAHVGKFELR
jgi:hypothetical protein